ncbi:single-stranded DNA-binding protein [Ruminococcus sp. Marseille-P6503]|uniref:single-stranded DNA-binding protein n=1 Tax=Ruminococcus sp. Marseille-P6503 TaxID=2364796 RepID=UPI000F51E21C|nr:single-stranded DNA-binding protein [Ruminococcus sp. Marseille-P6503]
MLNRVVLMGRIAQDIEVRQTPNGISVVSFPIAVDRSFKGQNGERQTDFINCVAWRHQADFIGRYFSKGRMIALEGNLRTRTYDDKNGTKHYVTEVFVDNISFTGEKVNTAPQGGYQNNYGPYPDNGGYQNNNYYQQNNSYSDNSQQQTQQPNDAKAIFDEMQNISAFDDFEELSDDGVPF